MYLDVSERLKEVLGIRNISLHQLAEMCKIPYETLRNLYYAKNKNPRLETLIAICKTLDITMDYLTGFTKYDKNELRLLKIYQQCNEKGKSSLVKLNENFLECGRHGRDFLLIISRFEADYTTYLRKKQNNKHTVTCLIPEGHVADGFEYTTCTIEQVETVFDDAFMAIKITTDNFIPTFLNGDIIALANRYPIEGEKAVYYKDGRAYIREYNRETNGNVVLKTINGIGKDFILKDMNGFSLIGTYINVIRWQ